MGNIEKLYSIQRTPRKGLFLNQDSLSYNLTPDPHSP